MEKFNTKFYVFVLLALVAILALSLVFVYKPRYIYRPLHRFFSTHPYRTLNAHDITTIRPWMTFDYLNNVFKLPKNYLKTTLAISDARYPNISLGSYAAEEKMSSQNFIVKVQEALHSYLISKK